MWVKAKLTSGFCKAVIVSDMARSLNSPGERIVTSRQSSSHWSQAKNRHKRKPLNIRRFLKPRHMALNLLYSRVFNPDGHETSSREVFTMLEAVLKDSHESSPYWHVDIPDTWLHFVSGKRVCQHLQPWTRVDPYGDREFGAQGAKPFADGLTWLEAFLHEKARSEFIAHSTRLPKDPDVRRQVVDVAVACQLEADPIYVTTRSLLTLFERHAHCGGMLALLGD